VGSVFSPLDEELGLLPGTLAPRQHEHLVHLASWMPFAKVSAMLARLLGVQVGEETVRRLTQVAGRRVEEGQTQAASAPWQEERRATAPPARLVISADGAYVPLLNGQWAEVRTLAIGSCLASEAARTSSEDRVGDLSYFSRMTSAEHFIELAEVETRRRCLVQAQQVGAVMDGAGWLQGLVDVHRPDAVRILDFPHAAEHLSLLLQALQQAGISLPTHCFSRLLHHLKHRGPGALLRLASRLPPQVRERDGVREQLGYFQKRESQMNSPLFRAQGWPIGSGSVESANKLLVQARLKGAGMHWQPRNVNPMLALRTGVCNDRWAELWHMGQRQVSQQQQCQRRERARRRRERLLVLRNPLLLTSPVLPPHDLTLAPLPALLSTPPAPAATLPGSSRPSAHHPWKRGPACVPKKTFAKT
jgi:hypothetical protein